MHGHRNRKRHQCNKDSRRLQRGRAGSQNGKCGCTSVLPCCYSWSKVRQRGNTFLFTAKLSGPDSREGFIWSYTVKKSDSMVEVTVEDARDKTIFSGYYPPTLEEWTAKGWEISNKGGRAGRLRLVALLRLQMVVQGKGPEGKIRRPAFDDWKCPACKVRKRLL